MAQTFLKLDTGVTGNLNLATNVTGTLPTSNYVGGKVLQIQSSTISSQVVITSTSPTDVGLSATITPSNTSNNIMIIATATIVCTNDGVTGSGAVGWSITDSSNNVIIGSSGDANPMDLAHHNTSNWYSIRGVQTKTIIHSPNTNSAFTYKMRGENGTASNVTFNYNGSYGATSSIILMEIEG